MTRRWTRLLAVAAALFTAPVLSACSGDDADPPPAASEPAQGDPAAWDEPAAAKAGGKLGTACPVPAVFDVAEKWVPKETPAGLANAGNAGLCYEIDAKPAGLIGFIRVWAVPKPGADVKAELQAFVADGAQVQHQLRQTTAGGQPAWEAVSATPDERGRVFAVGTPKGVFVVSWRGLDDDEYQAGLPAYVLAKSTLSV